MTTQQYREWYLKKLVAKTYHPLIHLNFNVGVFLFLIIGHFVRVQRWNLPTLIILISVILLGNMVVWVLHRYPLHRQYRWWRFPYKAHKVEHHLYFTSEYITCDRLQDYAAIFFPMGVIACLALVVRPLLFFSLTPHGNHV